jgi:hypothetical protein
MHASNFLAIAEGDSEAKRELTLSREVSEWLFSQRFWDQVNDVHGTFFGQYEEECVSGQLAKDIASLLRAKVGEPDLLGQDVVRFRYGWNEQKEELFCSVASNSIRTEILRLADLLATAAADELVIYCQL